MAAPMTAESSALFILSAASRGLVLVEEAWVMSRPLRVPTDELGVTEILTTSAAPPLPSWEIARSSAPANVQVWSAVQAGLKLTSKITLSPEVVTPEATLTTRASVETPRPVPARTDSSISKVIDSGSLAPVMVRLVPEALRVKLSPEASAVGLVPSGVTIVDQAAPAPLSPAQAQTSV